MDKNNPKNVSGAQFVQPPESFQVRSATSELDFATEDLLPGLGEYVGVDDRLQVSCVAQAVATSVICNIRLMRPDGVIVPLVFVVNIGSIHVVTTGTFQLIEGWILSATLLSSGNVNPSAPIFAWASLIRPPNNIAAQYQTLISGYVAATLPLTFPNGLPQASTVGAGGLHSQVITTPGAGADFTFTIPALTRMRIISLSATLATAVAVASRFAELVIDDGVNVVAEIAAPAAQAASLTDDYTWADSIPEFTAIDAVVMAPLPSQLILPVGFRIRSETTAIQAADQWSAITMLVQEWSDVV
jgi:hypothetical protein